MALGILYGNVVFKDLLRAAPYAMITVYERNTTDKAELFDVQTRAAISNPIQANATGLFACAVDGGAYDLVASLGGLTATDFDIVYSLSGTLAGSGSILSPWRTES